MAHLQNFISASDQSSLMVHSKIDFSYLLSKYFPNVEIISHVISSWKSWQCHCACEVVSKVWAYLCFNAEQHRIRNPLHSFAPWPSQACILHSCAKLNLCYSGCRYLNFLKPFFALRTFNVDIVHNLKKKLEILLTTNLIFFFLFLQEISFLPLVLDGVFLHKPPEEILAGKEFKAVPFMIGVTNNEFGWNIRSVI